MCCVTTEDDVLTITNMMMDTLVNSSVCLYQCGFTGLQQRPRAHCGRARALLPISQCKPFLCDMQLDPEYDAEPDEKRQDDERGDLRRNRRDLAVDYGPRCNCTCLNFECNCANNPEPRCHVVNTWICHVGTINSTGAHYVSTCGCMCGQPT